MIFIKSGVGDGPEVVRLGTSQNGGSGGRGS